MAPLTWRSSPRAASQTSMSPSTAPVPEVPGTKPTTTTSCSHHQGPPQRPSPTTQLSQEEEGLVSHLYPPRARGPARAPSRIQPAPCPPRWSRCCRRGFSAALPCEERKHRAATEAKRLAEPCAAFPCGRGGREVGQDVLL